VPFKRTAGLVLAGILITVLTACGGNGEPDGSGPQSTLISGTSVSSAASEIDSPRIDLKTTLSTTYYQVEGTNTEDIFASIEANGPTDTVGQVGSGLTSVAWVYAWSGPPPPGECSIVELTITADITVELPVHVDETSLSPDLLANWHAYVEGVAEHEQRHVDIYLQGAEQIKAALAELGPEANCDALELRIDAVWKEQQAQIDSLQESFHADEAEALAARRGPLEVEIAANRARLDTLRSQIYELDQDITRLRAEVSVFDNEVASLDAQIKQINDEFPDELPPEVRERLQQLIEQSNDLLFVYNQRVDEHNATINVRNALSDQYDSLLLETNDLVDQYNWTR
jgi:predicted secreted Zn-dependent protease